jgi:Phasin protein
METKGKRTARVVRSPVITIPEEGSTEAPVQVLPPELAEPTAPVMPEPPEVVVERVPAEGPTIAPLHREPADTSDDAFAAIEEARTAMTRGFHALSDEVVDLARCGIDTSARAAIEMLSVKTFSDVITVNTGFARASFGNWLDGSAKCCELGTKLAVETARPFLARLSKSWSLAARPSS